MFCKNCGAEVNDNAVICVKCGCSLEKGDQNNSKVVIYILLGVFLGPLGVHNFYIGKNGIGLLQLLLSLLSLGILAPFVSLWAIIEVCLNAKNVK